MKAWPEPNLAPCELGAVRGCPCPDCYGAEDEAAANAATDLAEPGWEESEPLPKRARADLADRPCDCEFRNRLFASMGLPPGECPPCKSRRWVKVRDEFRERHRALGRAA